MVQRAQCPSFTVTGRARTRHKLPAGFLPSINTKHPKKPPFYPAHISEDEKLCFGKSAEMLRVG